MNACFQKLYNTVSHCKMYTISYFKVLIFFAHQGYEPCHVGYSYVPFSDLCVYSLHSIPTQSSSVCCKKETSY